MPGKNKSGHIERSLVLLKPDAVQRGLVGEIITRFERKGLKIVAMKMVWPTEALAKKHYDQPESAMLLLGQRTIAAYKSKGIDDKRDPMDIAGDIQKKLVKYLSGGPIVAMVIEGAHAVEHVRKIRGHTEPRQADVGTITADFTIDSYFLSDEDDRAIRNLVHASGNVEEAEQEIKTWFSPEEIHNYNLAIDQILYSKEWEDTFREMVKGK
jgi:nucleoside-diphosphate kinase